MRIPRWSPAAIAALLGAAVIAPAWRGDDASLAPRLAFAGAPTAGPTIALLATPPGGDHTSLYLARAGEAAAGAPVATFTHREDAAVRGAVIPGGAVVLAVADTSPSRDLSFAASLFRVAPHRPPEVLCDRVVHASRPLITPAGRVFVSRGVAGPAVEGAFRADDLTIDEIDPATGAARTVLAHSGYLTFLAGAAGADVLVYRVSAAGADLAAVDPDTGHTRVLAQLLPFARDFSVEGGAVIFQERAPHDARRWTIDRLDLATLAHTTLHTDASASLAPFAWPGGGVAWSRDGRDGLSLLQGARPLAEAPLGAGVDLARSVSSDAAWVALLHTVPGKLPVPFAVDARTGAAAAVPAPAGARVEIAGFVAGGAL